MPKSNKYDQLYKDFVLIFISLFYIFAKNTLHDDFYRAFIKY